MTELILGTAQLGLAYGINNVRGALSEEQSFEVLDAAWECGVRMLDTAEDYGASESVIGNYHTKHPDRRFQVCTKLSGSFASQEESLAAHIEEAASRLNVDSISVYYLHRFEMFKDDILMAELSTMKSSGLIMKVGVSIYEPDELRFILQSNKSVDVVQIPFNVFDCERWLQGGLLDEAVSSGIEIFARSIYLQGAIFKDPEELDLRALGLSEAVECLQGIASEHEATISRLACDFVKDTAAISGIVLGSESPIQVEENAELISLPSIWSEEDRARVLAISADLEDYAVDPRVWPTRLSGFENAE